MALESKTFFEVVEKHGLVSEKQFLKLKRAIKKESISQSDLDTLVANKYLSKWQAARLLSGKHSFSVGDFTLLDFVGKDAYGEVYLVRPRATGKGIKRLRLVSKAISEDPGKIKKYLGRVQAFKSVANPRLTDVTQISEVGGRHFVVSNRPSGKPITNGLLEKPQPDELVGAMIGDVANVVGDLETAQLKHGSIDPCTICLNEEKGWFLDLPVEIGFADITQVAKKTGIQNKGNKKQDSDVGALAVAACRLLEGGSPERESEFVDRLNSVTSNPQSTLAELKAAVEGVASKTSNPAPDDIDSLSEQAAVEVVSVEEVAEAQAIDDPAAVEVPPLPSSENLPASDSLPDPQNSPVAAESISINTTGSTGTQQENTNSNLETESPDPIAANPVSPEQPTTGGDVMAGGLADLEAIDKQDDMFGDFDQVEVVSEIQAPQPKVAAMPVVVESQNAETGNNIPQESPTNNQDQEPKPESNNNNKVLLFAAIGGGVGVVVLGLVIFFLIWGNKNNPEDQLAKNQNNVVSEEKDEEKKTDAVKAKEKESPSDEEETKNALKSSGLFKGIGAFNKQNPNAGLTADDKSAPEKNEVESGGKNSGQPPQATADKDGSTDKTGANNANEPKKVGGIPGVNSKTTLPGINQPNKNTKPAPKNEQSPNIPGITPPKKKNDTKPKDGKTAPEKQPAGGGEKSKDDKSNEVEDPPVLLIGKSKKDDAKKKGGQAPGKLNNPFAKSPHFVSIKPAKRGEDNTAFQKLLPLSIPPSLPLNVTMHGGDRASKTKIVFELKASTSENATWIVSAGTKNQQKPLAKFHFDGKDFGFSWDKSAGGFSNSIYLTNCALRIQASEFKHVLALRTPAVSTPIDFTGVANPKGDAKIENPPNMEYVKVVFVDIPKNFPKFDFPKGKDFLIGKEDSLVVAFKKENIDIIRGLIASKLRGSKLAVNFGLSYVTPDKQLQPLTSLKRFEIAADKVTNEFKQMDARLKQLNEQYKLLETKEAKAEFSRQTGRVKLQEQVNLSRRYSTHLSNTLSALTAISKMKIKFRVFYQAGEIEVDLATPDGKRYLPPRPAAAANGKAGNAKK